MINLTKKLFSKGYAYYSYNRYRNLSNIIALPHANRMFILFNVINHGSIYIYFFLSFDLPLSTKCALVDTSDAPKSLGTSIQEYMRFGAFSNADY